MPRIAEPPPSLAEREQTVWDLAIATPSASLFPREVSEGFREELLGRAGRDLVHEIDGVSESRGAQPASDARAGLDLLTGEA